MRYRGRFAPSPTGHLHLGSLVAAVGSWLRARMHGGSWIVRIEDLDPPREIAGASQHIINTLKRFGLESDEAIVYQSERTALYESALRALIDAGLAYRCVCSRNDLHAFGGVHPNGKCLRVTPTGGRYAWRLKVADEDVDFVDLRLGPQSQSVARDVGDFVLRRSEGWFAYQLAVVVDDAQQHINEVVRGADLLDSTPRQILLQRHLALPTPDYLHLPLVLDSNGDKLSKQDRARSVDADNPVPALAAALRHLGLGEIRASNAPAMLEAALHSGALQAHAMSIADPPGNVALQREV